MINLFSNVLRLLLIIFFLVVSSVSKAQDTLVADSLLYTMNFDELFGLDQNLINGRRYVPAYPLAPGHPYLDEDEFQTGAITVCGVHYTDVWLKYNINEQRIVMEYTSRNGGKDHLLLNNHLIDQFEISDRLFKKLKLTGLQPQFYQIITSGNLTLLYFWKKNLVLNSGSSRSYYKYSGQFRVSHLLVGQNIYKLKRRKSFYALIPPDIVKEIKFYVRDNNIDIKSAGDEQMRLLLDKWQELL